MLNDHLNNILLPYVFLIMDGTRRDLDFFSVKFFVRA